MGAANEATHYTWYFGLKASASNTGVRGKRLTRPSDTKIPDSVSGLSGLYDARFAPKLKFLFLVYLF